MMRLKDRLAACPHCAEMDTLTAWCERRVSEAGVCGKA
ncbi:MAG: YheV family putative metal-binding protein [Clostridium sp.]|nr:YheV family putative metal-binding protein [Clostridium sp.]